ncbi:type II secretion system F family protein [Thermostilla marina]
MGLFRQRIALGELIQLCRRLAVSTATGIGMRQIWKREAERCPRPLDRAVFREIAEHLEQGSSLEDALKHTGDFFPTLFRRFVVIGEKTGALPEVMRRLAEHYERQRTRRRVFWGLLAWPLCELALALTIIGFLIWIMGAIGQRADMEIDPLGFGLTGTSGLLVYLGCLAAIGTVIAVVVWAIRRQLAWTKPVQIAVSSLPGAGRIWRAIALSQFAWTLQLLVRTGIDIRQAIDSAFEAAGNAYYGRFREQVRQAIDDGQSLTAALAQCGVFDSEFLDAVQTGEESGRLEETLASLAKEYDQRASTAMTVQNTALGVLIVGLIVAVIVFFIFRLALFYINTIYSNLPQ